MRPCGVKRQGVPKSRDVGHGRRKGALAALVVALAACGGGHHTAAPAPTTSSTTPPTSAGTTTTTLDPTKAAVLAAYRAAWTDFLAVASTFPVRPLDPRLAQHESGAEFRHDQQSLTVLSAKGHYSKGGVDLAPIVVSFVDDSATVMDCLFDHSVEMDAKTHSPVSSPDVGHTSDRFTLTRANGRWFVSDSTILDPGTRRDACTPAG
jgi:hypothetical protein